MSIERLVVTAVAIAGALAILTTVSAAPEQPQVPYPDGFRAWQNVKSGLIGPAHKRFASVGGFTHVYANPQAMQGYRTREFPEGSVIVFEWLDMTEKDGAYIEGARRQVDVMLKDAEEYAGTGGWGFQSFVKSSKTELNPTQQPHECFECHEKLRKDGLVLSHYRQ